MNVDDFAALVSVDRNEIYRGISCGRLRKSAMRSGRGWAIDPVLGREEWVNSAKRATAAELAPKEKVPPWLADFAAPLGGEDETEDDLPVGRMGFNPEDEIPALGDSRARKEAWIASQAELDYRQTAGTLVEAATLRRQAFAVGRMIRDSAGNIADRLSPKVAALRDEFECHREISAEVYSYLNHIFDEIQRLVQSTSVSGGAVRGIGAAATADD